ncbi:hypothetical protein BDB01DRAFT_850566 [Pilobolus umbonatus]|nr:hypothetical protein BDB01DRAFT_850566 [Pilobolus umbonatus]
MSYATLATINRSANALDKPVDTPSKPKTRREPEKNKRARKTTLTFVIDSRAIATPAHPSAQAMKS